MKSSVKVKTLALAVCASVVAPMAFADEKPKSAEEVARELANPNSSLASLTFKNQYRTYKGDLPGADDQDSFTTLFQPVFPFPLEATASGAKQNIFLRPAIPILYNQPTPKGNGDWDSTGAMGDIGFDFAYGVTEKTGFLWAAGVVGTLPTATDKKVAGKQWRLGPEILLAQAKPWGLYGIFPSHQWDIASTDSKGDSSYSTTQIQPILKYLPGGGWAVATSPIMNYDWKSEEWTVPLNLQVSKTTPVGGVPVKFEFEVNYYVDQPDAFGPEWMIGLNITPVVNNFINDWIRGY